MRKLSVLMILILIMQVFLSISFSEDVATEESYLRNLNLRKAIAYVLDRDAILSSISDYGFDLLPVNYLIPEGFYSVDGIDFREYDSKVGYKYKIKSGIKRWEKAKKELGVSEITLTYYCVNTPAHNDLASEIKEQIESALDGITIEVHVVENMDELIEVGESGNYDMLTVGWSPDSPDPTDYLNVFGEDGSNWGNYHNPQYLELLDLAEDESNLKKRMKILQQAETVLLKDVPIFTMFEWTPHYIVYFISMNVDGGEVETY